MTRVSAKKRPDKPKKPYPDFPLFPHATGRWAKKIRGRLHYFGPWRDPEAALAKYLDQRDDLHAGRTPRVSSDTLSVAELCNRFLTAKQARLSAGEITARTFQDYHAACARLVEFFGKRRPVADLASDDFESLRKSLSKHWGPVTLGNEITRMRVVFNFAYQNHLIDRPVRYGQAFNKPPKRVLRQARFDAGPKLFEAAEVRAILEASSIQLRGMVFLGINCGFGNDDCGTLPLSAVNLAAGWIDYPRPKTSIERRCPLWAETVEAIEEANANRPVAKNEADAGLVFLTRCGQRWSNGTKANPISRELRKVLQGLGLYRRGRGFYSLRHTFRTVADGSRDQAACNALMGHVDATMAGVYRERIDDERLVAVTEHVHDWLFGV